MGLTFDTGALIGLERRDRRIALVWAAALARKIEITVPTIVVAEWSRGQRGHVARILDGVRIEALTLEIARSAGNALAEVGRKGASVADAIVMASAATRGDVVYTADFDDLQRFQRIFPGVRVLGVGR